MEMNRNDSNISVFKKLYENTLEQSIDTDFTLPDYYPEITKIIKCLQEVSILSTKCSDGRLSIGGQVVLTLMYLGSDEQLNSFTHIYPFAKSVDAQGIDGEYIKVAPKIAYLNTKATAPRRIEAHGSASLNVSVSRIENVSVLSFIEAEGVHTRAEEIIASSPVSVVAKSTFVEDEINIPQTKPTIGKILRYNATPTITECKNVSGKTVVKGDVNISMLYCPSDAKTPILVREQKGFSQIIDCDCDTDDGSYKVCVKTDSIELHPKTSLDGEVRTVNYEIKLTIELVCYNTKKAEVITDAFSTKYHADIKYYQLNVESIAERVNESFVCKKSLDFSNTTISEIYDAWSEAVVEHTACDGNEMLLSGVITVHVLGVDIDNQPLYFERAIDFEHRIMLEKGSDETQVDADIFVNAMNYYLNGETVDVEIELLVKAMVFSLKTLKVITDIKPDTQNLLAQENDAAIVLYYAENESVWSIAEKYKTSPKAICKANDVEGTEVLCNKMLLIPKV